jgi:hypothetical protein
MAWMRVERVHLQTIWLRRCEGIEYLPTLRLGTHKMVVPTEAVSPNTDAGREGNERIPSADTGSGDEAETPFADDSTQSPLRGGEKTRRDLPRSLCLLRMWSVSWKGRVRSKLAACCRMSALPVTAARDVTPCRRDFQHDTKTPHVVQESTALAVVALCKHCQTKCDRLGWAPCFGLDMR